MLALAQCWNLLAGYAGLVSVGQQAFVGLGAYAMFALRHPVRRRSGARRSCSPASSRRLLAMPTAFFIFRLRRRLFRHRHLGRRRSRSGCCFAQWKALGGGTGTSLPRDAPRDMLRRRCRSPSCSACARPRRATSSPTGWRWSLAVATIGFIYRVLRSRAGPRPRRRPRQRAGRAQRRRRCAAHEALGLRARAAFGTGIAGALIYLQKARISPDAAFSVLDWTAYVIFIVVIGGIGTIEGPIIGVIVFFLLQDQLADFGSWYLMLLGAARASRSCCSRRRASGASFSDRYEHPALPGPPLLGRSGTLEFTDIQGGPHG